MFKVESVNKRELDAFHSDIASIKQYLCEVGNTYLLIAFRIYEMYRNGNYKKYYKTIVEACQAELGFKKSTTYNMINIVKRFGRPDIYGSISYQTFVNLDYSYSQLCEMLSLSDKQLESVTPQTTVKELREMKKVQTSGKSNVIDVSFDKIEEVNIDFTDLSEVPEPAEALDPIEVEPSVLDLKCACTCLECRFAFINFKKSGKIDRILCTKFNYHYVDSDFYCAFADFNSLVEK